MDPKKEDRAAVNPAARHDPPGARDNAEPSTPKKGRQVEGKQDAPLNPLEPGGIGD